MSEFLNRLLASDESEGLDFKSEWHTNTGNLIHDILCLANSRHKGDKHLVIGVQDNGTVVGVQPANRKTQAQLNDFIRACRLNVMPSVMVKTFQHSGHEIDVIKIKQAPEKPYFLTADYAYQGVRARAGVVYSRIADTNTPIDGSLDDKKIEEMYRERFRLDQTPLQRLSYLLDDLSNWEHNGDRTSVFFNSYWPEMKIIQEERESDLERFEEPWVKIFPDQNAYRYKLEVVYMGTILRTLYWITCDGGRFQTIMPSHQPVQINGDHWRRFYYFMNGSLEHKINRLLQSVYPTHQTSYNPDFIIFNKHFEKEQFFSQAANRATVPYAFYEQTGSGQTHREFKVFPDGRRHQLSGPR